MKLKIKASTKTHEKKPLIKLSNTKPSSSRDALFGTGLTKKSLTKAVNADQKVNKISLKALKSDPLKNAEKLLKIKTEQNALRSAELPQDVLKLPAIDTSGIELDESQRQAIVTLKGQQFGCLIGAAGTGKTTIQKMLVEATKNEFKAIDVNILTRKKGAEETDNSVAPVYSPPIAFLAFMGKAVQQMKRALPSHYHAQCKTIHAHLGYYPEYDEILDEKGNFRRTMRFVPYFTEHNKLPYKIYFIDEAGTPPIDLWNNLRRAMLPDARVYLIGDINQLQPVMGRSVLAYAMSAWPTCELTTIHRQKMPDGSEEVHPIIAASQNILKGAWPRKRAGIVDMIKIPSEHEGSSKSKIFLYRLIKHLKGANEFDEKRDAIIVAQNTDNLGQEQLNEMFIPFFNPTRKVDGVAINPRVIVKTGKESVILAQGDKIMLLENDGERGLTNGMMGYITEIRANPNFDNKRVNLNFHEENLKALDQGLENFELNLTEIGNIKQTDDEKEAREVNQRQASHIVTVRFDDVTVDSDGNEVIGRDVEFRTAGDFKKMRHAYAFTCHKSQGGEYHTVVILVHSANSILLSREWLYTAVTRAKERVIIVYNDYGFTTALKTQRIKGKTLEEKIKSFNEATREVLHEEKPLLPKPVTIENIDIEE